MGNETDIPSEVEVVSGSVRVGIEEIEESFEIEDAEEEEKQGTMEITEEYLYVAPEDCKANEVKGRNIVFPIKYKYSDELREGLGTDGEGLKITKADNFSVEEEEEIHDDAENFLREEGEVVFVNKNQNFLLILTEDEYDEFMENVRDALDKLEEKL